MDFLHGNSLGTALYVGTSPGASIDLGDAMLHIAIVALAITVLTVSLLAYERRRTRRYLLLTLGFFFIFLSQFATLLEVIFLSNALIIIPSIGLHLSHVFDFLTLIFFLLAISGYGQSEPRRKTIEVPFSGASKVPFLAKNALESVSE
jgi:hypothetical protein